MSIDVSTDGIHTTYQSFDVFQRTFTVRNFLNVSDSKNEEQIERSFINDLPAKPPDPNTLKQDLIQTVNSANFNCSTSSDETVDIQEENRSEVDSVSGPNEQRDYSEYSECDVFPGLIVREITDVDDLFDVLELVDVEEQQVDDEKAQISDVEILDEIVSLLDFSELEEELVTFPEEGGERFEEEQEFCEENEEEGELGESEVCDYPVPVTPISDLTMSQEARSAIFETLQDMTGTSSSKVASMGHTDIRFKGVTVQKRLRENRSKYDTYKNLSETKMFPGDRDTSYERMRRGKSGSVITKGTGNKRSHKQASRYKTFGGSGGSAAENNDYSSSFSSEDRECDDSSSERGHFREPRTKGTQNQTHNTNTLPQVQGRLEAANVNKLPSIGSLQKHRRTKTIKSASSASVTNTHNSKNVVSLEDAFKLHKYRLPGIGKYEIMLEEEKEFEITPPGFDSRYGPRPNISQQERDPPPQAIQEKSIQKCKRWLKNVNVFPMSLTPTQRPQ